LSGWSGRVGYFSSLLKKKKKHRRRKKEKTDLKLQTPSTKKQASRTRSQAQAKLQTPISQITITKNSQYELKTTKIKTWVLGLQLKYNVSLVVIMNGIDLRH
jgi:hypothetical protein